MSRPWTKGKPSPVPSVNEFWVTVQRTEASERCGLSGSYWLKAENDVLILKDSKIKKKILVWPYKLLRRYGRDRVSPGGAQLHPDTLTAVIISYVRDEEGVFSSATALS